MGGARGCCRWPLAGHRHRARWGPAACARLIAPQTSGMRCTAQRVGRWGDGRAVQRSRAPPARPAGSPRQTSPRDRSLSLFNPRFPTHTGCPGARASGSVSLPPASYWHLRRRPPHLRRPTWPERAGARAPQRPWWLPTECTLRFKRMQRKVRRRASGGARRPLTSPATRPHQPCPPAPPQGKTTRRAKIAWVRGRGGASMPQGMTACGRVRETAVVCLAGLGLGRRVWGLLPPPPGPPLCTSGGGRQRGLGLAGVVQGGTRGARAVRVWRRAPPATLSEPPLPPPLSPPPTPLSP